ncbi:glycine-rich domain-containing protein [Aestuariivivens sediminis]|uniref:glycine-rich domain-containing protein n=1 Tax=Aestuariivivens sediminis TaxID=2913557 RepID=UPI001F597700|nr:CxxxxCH/CxxCH domain-containing protein [Aestuariivivens sediminis]
MNTKKHYITLSLFKLGIVLFLFGLFQTVCAQTTRTFTTSDTWQAPPTVTSVTVECWGAGGAGGSGNRNSLGSGGGGGGAYSYAVLIVIPGNFYTVNVGLGGLPEIATNGDGNPGGDSWFISNTTILAKGGSGGIAAIGNTPGAGGAGGLESEGIGAVRWSGGSGGSGNSANTGGGGGSSAGTDRIGNNGGTPAGGNTPTTPTDGGAGGNGGISGNGSPGLAPGGGGGGEGDKGDGGAGANGQVRLTYTEAVIPTITLDNTALNVCKGDTSVDLSYSATTNNPDQYSIDYDANAEGQGFVDVTLAVLPTSPISLGVPPSAAEGTYNAIFTVTISGGETSPDYPITISVNQPTAPTLSSNSPVCSGEDAIFSISGTPGDQVTYTGDALGTATIGGGGTVDVTISEVTADVILNLTLVDDGTCTRTLTDTETVTVNPLPTAPTLSSNSPVCSGEDAIFTISGIPGDQVTYAGDASGIATIGGGGTVDVTISGVTADVTLNLTLVDDGTCTRTLTNTETVTVNPLPTAPTLSSNSPVCTGDDAIFTISGTPNDQVTYTGDASGTTTIGGGGTVDVTISGVTADVTLNLTLVDDGTCTRTLSGITETVSVNDVVSAGPISGLTTVTENTSGLVYSVDLVAGAISYTWTVPGNPGGWGPITGQGTNSITVTSGTQGGDITVYVTNSCGDGPLSTLAVTVTAGTPPTITLADANPSVVQGTTTADITYSATTENPDLYSINYDVAAEAQGFVDVTDAVLPASPITLVVPAGAVPSTYDGILTVKNSSTGLSSGNYAITVTITPGPPTITLGAMPSVTEGTTTANLPYSATTNSPDQYSIDYDVTAEGQGFLDVTSAALPVSPIVLVVPGTAIAAIYNAVLTVRNSTTGLTSTNYAITITVTAGASPPTITLGAMPSVSEGTTTANLPYTATTNGPDQYSIDYDATAEGQGFVDINLNALPSSPIILTVPVAATAGVYNGNLTVRNSSTGLSSSSYSITVTISTAVNPPTITLGKIAAICSGTTQTDLPYSNTTNDPNKYSIRYLGDAEISAGFTNVILADLGLSPIALTVPATAPAGQYYGNLTVTNTTTGLTSVNYVIIISVSDVLTPSVIYGEATVAANSSFSYAVLSAPDATYNWTLPSGWSFDGASNTNRIKVITGAVGNNGNITVNLTNACGTGPTESLAVTVNTTTDHSLYNCTSCHITHNAPGSSLTAVAGNALLCQSCHTSTGAASAKPLVNPDNGTSSHAWDVLAENDTKEVWPPSDSSMQLRIVDNKIICSTCHNQHENSAGSPYLRIDNTGDLLCKDCHRKRDKGLYSTDNSNNRGSHPVGVTYNGGDSRFNAAPTNTQLVNSKVECSSCHGVHDDVTGSLGLAANGNLLRTTNDASLCTDCHNYGTHNGMDCLDCHEVHNTVDLTVDDNIYMIKRTITTPVSGNKNVIFTTRSGNNSFADGLGADNPEKFNGICEVCHDPNYDATPLSHFLNNGSGSDQYHTSQGAGIPGQTCTNCHPHSSNFSPSGGGCTSCHETNAPTFTSAVHVTHKDRYGFACSTCHFGHGSGGASEPTHPSGTINIVFDPNGLATRNGLDTNTPDPWTGTTCNNIYCHSNGGTANKYSEGVSVWNSDSSATTMVYSTTPDWTTGSITACNSCHPGPSMPDAPAYTIVEGTGNGVVTANDQYPNTGAHGANTGAHNSPDQLLVITEDANYGTALSHSWPKVQCFWCHNNDPGAASGVAKYQGTYGTSKHVDGKVWFYSFWYGWEGGGEKTSGGQAPDYYLMDTEAEINALGAGYVWHPAPADPDEPGKFLGSMVPGLGYSWVGPTNEHCGNGKNCW